MVDGNIVINLSVGQVAARFHMEHRKVNVDWKVIVNWKVNVD